MLKLTVLCFIGISSRNSYNFRIVRKIMIVVVSTF